MTVIICFVFVWFWTEETLILLGVFFFLFFFSFSFFFFFWTVWTLIRLACFMINTNKVLGVCRRSSWVPIYTSKNIGWVPWRLYSWHPGVSLQSSGCPNELSPRDCATEDVPNRTHTLMHTETRPSKVTDWTQTGLMVLVCTNLWDLDWFQMATELYHVLKCVFPASRALCLMGVHYYFWLLLLLLLLFMIIIICHHCLLKIGTSRFVCPLMPLQKKINYCY